MMKQNAVELLTDPAAAARSIETPLGRMLAVANEGELLRLEFVDEGEPDHVARRLGPAAQFVDSHAILDALARELAEYLAGERSDFSVPVAPRGTDFERRAWAYLRTIPYGQTRSYGQQARAVAGPNAARAVGRANGCNPIAILVPCHRVIGADGALTGFAAGIHRKRWLLDHEQRVRPADGMLPFDR